MTEAQDRRGGDALTAREREVLDALCRPLREDPASGPATNQEIADEVFLSVDAVKGHLRAIYAKLGLESLPQNQKRARLAELALAGKVLGVLRRRRRADLLRSRAVVSPAMAGAALALLAAVAIAVVPGGEDGGDTAGPSSGEAEGLDEPIAPVPDAAPRAHRGGKGSPGPGPSVLFDDSGGLLPIELASNETVHGAETTFVEDGGEPVAAPPTRRTVVRESRPRSEASEPDGATETETVAEPAPAPRKRNAERRSAQRRATEPRNRQRQRQRRRRKARQQQAQPHPVRRERCVIRTRRVVKPKVVWRRKRVKVRHRFPHEHQRTKRVVYWEPHTVVWRDRKGRRHERTEKRRRVRHETRRWNHWHVRTRREIRRVRVVVRRVRIIQRRVCS